MTEERGHLSRTAPGNLAYLVLRYRVLEFVTWVLTINAALKGNANSRPEIYNQLTKNWEAGRDTFLLLIFARLLNFLIIVDINRAIFDNLLHNSLYNVDVKPSPLLD